MVGCGAGAAAQARAVRQQPWSVEAGARRGAHSHARRTSNPGSRSPSSCPPCMTAAHRAATATRPRPGSAFQAARAGRGPRPRLDLHAPLALLLVEADAAVLRLMRAGAQARALAVRAAAAAGAAVRVEHLRARQRPSRPPPASGECRVGRLRRPCFSPPLAARPGPGSTGATASRAPTHAVPAGPRARRARRVRGGRTSASASPASSSHADAAPWPVRACGSRRPWQECGAAGRPGGSRAHLGAAAWAASCLTADAWHATVAADHRLLSCDGAALCGRRSRPAARHARARARLATHKAPHSTPAPTHDAAPALARSSKAYLGGVHRRRRACPTWQWLPARSPDDSARDAARQPRARPAPGAASHLTAAQASGSPSLQPVPASGLRRMSARCRHGRGGGESGACSSGSSARGRRPSRLLGARAAAAGPPAPCCGGAMAAPGAPPPAAAATGAPAASAGTATAAPRRAVQRLRQRSAAAAGARPKRPAGMQHCVHVSGGPSPAAGAGE